MSRSGSGLVRSTWQQNTVRSALMVIRTLLRFGVSEGYTKAEPIKFKLPAAVRREKLLSGGEVQFLLDHAGRGNFRDVLIALIESGARPGEVCAVEARQLTSRRRGRCSRSSAPLYQISQSDPGGWDDQHRWWCWLPFEYRGEESDITMAPTAPLAICRAALKSTL